MDDLPYGEDIQRGSIAGSESQFHVVLVFAAMRR